MKKSFGDRLKELRGRKSQSMIASVFNIRQSTYSSWETGASKPDINELCDIARYFNVSADDLLGLSIPSINTKNSAVAVNHSTAKNTATSNCRDCPTIARLTTIIEHLATKGTK